jgi:hypothetical protein
MAMNHQLRILGVGFVVSMTLMGCKSKLESAGDTYLKAGDPAGALMQYESAISSGGLSEYGNYTKAYIELLRTRAEDYPNPELMDAMRDSVTSLLKQHPDPALEAQASDVMLEVGKSRLDKGTAFFEERAFMWMNTAAAFPGKTPGIEEKVANLKKNFVVGKLSEIEGKLNESDDNASVVADYMMNQLMLTVGGETDEMKALWTKINEKNLNTYLYYNLPGLLDQVDARINKYGLMIAVMKYDAKKSPILIGAKVWNLTSGPAEFTGTDFRLVDKQGNSYEPAQTMQGFKNKVAIELNKESEVGGVTFKLPKDAVPDYLELKLADGRSGRKYLP